jgi:uncharacterized radical SAM superfamily Fe-S cluster-containing enzyme
VHPHCGAATYVFVVDGKFVPITDFMDVEGFMEFLKENAEETSRSKIRKLRATAGLLSALRKFIDREVAPEGFDPLNLLANILFIGAMHFMDPYNYDLERVKRCGIHYATPDGRIIPFCSYNAIHRPLVERAFSKPYHTPTTE